VYSLPTNHFYSAELVLRRQGGHQDGRKHKRSKRMLQLGHLDLL